MLDKYLLPVTHVVLKPLVNLCVKYKIRANQITVIGFVIGILSVGFIVNQFYLMGLICIVVNRIFDGLDGEVARKTKPTQAGAFLDIVLDFIFYQAVVFAFAFSNPQFTFWAVCLMFSFVGTGTSFLAFSIFAQKNNIKKQNYPNKSIYYLTGIAEGTETILFFMLCCIWPIYFNWFAAVFCLICWQTTIFRIVYGVKQLNELDT
ncbi:MAG: CDP-alcohol phosphatidyltransferase family protein [Saccharospirillaceae bacterium]|nr:CDP-alcohol phosphatidyltransferase family protein [Pseudomonadales bacterium]NRB80951.1 CDP-alcohol phosphatidyltransferase family protein [Saccharospirillaceae bacterium]